MSEDDDKQSTPRPTQLSANDAVASGHQHGDTTPKGDAEQTSIEKIENAETAPLASDHVSSPETPSPETPSHTSEAPAGNEPGDIADPGDIPGHDIPQHTVPPVAAPEESIPPHEVPQHTVPPVNAQQAARAPTAAPADQMVEPNLVNRAVDVIASSSSQRDAVTRSFELQRATIAHGIKSRRDAAMEQAAAAKANIGQKNATTPHQGATAMNPQYAAPPQPQAAPGQQYQTGPQAGGTLHPGMAGYTGAAPLSNNEIIAQEFAATLRQIIAEEVDKQLKALLAAYTSADQPNTESPAE